jgi:hypothetical protein
MKNSDEIYDPVEMLLNLKTYYKKDRRGPYLCRFCNNLKVNVYVRLIMFWYLNLFAQKHHQCPNDPSNFIEIGTQTTEIKTEMIKNYLIIKGVSTSFIKLQCNHLILQFQSAH